MKKILPVLMNIIIFSLGAQEFRFQYNQGDQFRIQGDVDQWVYIDGELIQTAKIQNRITFEVLETREGTGFLQGEVFVFEQTDAVEPGYISNRLETVYPTRFWRDEKGYYEIEERYLMPVVRNVPIFPEGNLSPGDRWSAPGTEVHDMSSSFGSQLALRVPITVDYLYMGSLDPEQPHLHTLMLEYELFSPVDLGLPAVALQPTRISGYSRQILLWNLPLGRPESYEEEYSIALHLNSGEVYEFRGEARGIVVEAPAMNREDVRQGIEEVIREEGLEDEIRVEETDRGVMVTLDNIQFRANSDRFLPGEEEKLLSIARILSGIPDRDLLIEGHTALAGTAEARALLSTQRAAAVADFLKTQGVRDDSQMIIQGHGAQRPLDDNSTAQGMSRNRRVEITILEN